MMKSKWLRILIVLLTVSITFPTTSRADVDPDLFKLSVKVGRAIKKLNDSLGAIKKVEVVVKDIEEGRTPSVNENRWTNLASEYKQAAAESRDAPLPTDFDQTKYRVTLDELQSCATRQASLNKLRGFLTELKAAQVRGQTAIADLDVSLSEADKSREALRYLIKVHEKLVNVPIYGSIFTWDWFELNTDVSASLGELTSALKAQRKKVDDELAKLKLYIPNLEGNLTSLEGLSCGIEGTWNGTWSWTVPARPGIAPETTLTAPITIKIKRESGTLTGEFQFRDDPKLTLQNISQNADKATFSVTDTWLGEPTPYQILFSMTLANSNKTMSGTLNQTNRPHWKNSTATLTKQ